MFLLCHYFLFLIYIYLLLLLPFYQERVWQKWNATLARRHSLSCEGIDIGKRVKLMENSQSAKHSRVFAGLIAAPDSSVGGESMSDIRRQALQANSLSSRAKKRTKQSSILCSTEEDGRITSITKKQANRIIRSEVEAMVARGESLERFHDPFVTAAILTRCPAIAGYLPVDARTLFDRYVPTIDIETTLELTKMFSLLPGMLGVAFDGVTVNKKCKTLYTVSKGEMSMFWTWQDLGEFHSLLCLFYSGFDN